MKISSKIRIPVSNQNFLFDIAYIPNDGKLFLPIYKILFEKNKNCLVAVYGAKTKKIEFYAMPTYFAMEESLPLIDALANPYYIGFNVADNTFTFDCNMLFSCDNGYIIQNKNNSSKKYNLMFKNLADSILRDNAFYKKSLLTGNEFNYNDVLQNIDGVSLLSKNNVLKTFLADMIADGEYWKGSEVVKLYKQWVTSQNSDMNKQDELAK